MHAEPVSAVERSDNRKLGPVSATYVSQSSCPSDCPLFRKGCYAEHGYAGVTTARLNRSALRDAREIARREARAIAGLSGKRVLRLHVVGDARTNAAACVLGKAARSYAARGDKPARGKKVWTYTHAWKRVRRDSWGESVSVLASCETPAQARDAMAQGYAAALVVPSFESTRAYYRDGITVLPCPAQTHDDVTCESCGLCRDDERLRERGLVIAFAAHGCREDTVRKTLLSLPTV
jgi:hypothetical protein